MLLVLCDWYTDAISIITDTFFPKEFFSLLEKFKQNSHGYKKGHIMKMDMTQKQRKKTFSHEKDYSVAYSYIGRMSKTSLQTKK